MITKTVHSEFGVYDRRENHGYHVHSIYDCIDAYKDPSDDEHWEVCPCCELRPKVWKFDNGQSTACGCGESRYDHFSVHAESIMSHHKRNNGSLKDYDSDQLRKNWNEYCATMVNPCNHWDLYATRFLHNEDSKW